MSKQQIEDLRDHVAGIVAGRIIEAGAPHAKVVEISRNAGSTWSGSYGRWW